MFFNYNLGKNNRELLNSKIDKSVERVKAFDNVN